jgi:hypothetical protein
MDPGEYATAMLEVLLERVKLLFALLDGILDEMGAYVGDTELAPDVAAPRALLIVKPEVELAL